MGFFRGVIGVLAIVWVGAVGLELWATAQLWHMRARQGQLGRYAKFGLAAALSLLILVQAALLVPAGGASLPGNTFGQFGGSPWVFFSTFLAVVILTCGPAVLLQGCALRLGHGSWLRVLARAPLIPKVLWLAGSMLMVLWGVLRSVVCLP